uniref:Cap-specific mRNA (nucleoside-2'-O-)-methyltransferase 1 n=1 Tax=Rhabditophanes sp. KR3021 TaxID=114890 RepID=A0AC35TGK7_9BILA
MKRDAAGSIMSKMGYKEGQGLGKEKQGIVKPIAAAPQFGRAGLGSKSSMIKKDFTFSDKDEVKSVEEYPTWVSCPKEMAEEIATRIPKCPKGTTAANFESSWWTVNAPKHTIDDETRFCSKDTLTKMIEGKNIFETLSERELNNARARANPYESISSAFFQNRAAMKTANLDKIYGWLLSGDVNDADRRAKNPYKWEPDDLDSENVNEMNEYQRETYYARMKDRDETRQLTRVNADRGKEPFYFADVCAGPGGFTEYMLWRKGFMNAKGFGFTLIGDCDFNLHKFTAASPLYFHPYYGPKHDGDVMDPENLVELQKFVSEGTNGKFTDLVMCDGGFNVKGRENIQEILSKRLYLCQFISGLMLNRPRTEERPGGNFVVKIFDLFTPFSVGLIYLMYLAYEKVSIHKPHTSRPANSERYLVCSNLSEWGHTHIKEYLMLINKKLDVFEKKTRDAKKVNPKRFKGNNGFVIPNTEAEDHQEEDLYEIVPEEMMLDDEQFQEYVFHSNEHIGQRQIYYLAKYRDYAADQSRLDNEQERLRKACMEYWEIPEMIKEQNKRNNRQWGQKNDWDKEREYPNQILKKILRKCSVNFEGLRKFLCEPLTQKCIENESHTKRMRMEELRFRICGTTRAGDRGVLMATKANVYKYNLDAGEFQQLPFDKDNRSKIKIIPFHSLVMYEKVYLYEKKDNNKWEQRETFNYRITDAAMISGDYLGDQPFDVRIAAVGKMCNSISKTPGESNRLETMIMSEREKYLNEEVALHNGGIPPRGKKFLPQPLKQEDMILCGEIYQAIRIPGINHNLPELSNLKEEIVIHKINAQEIAFVPVTKDYLLRVNGFNVYEIFKGFLSCHYSGTLKTMYLSDSKLKRSIQPEVLRANPNKYYGSLSDFFDKVRSQDGNNFLWKRLKYWDWTYSSNNSMEASKFLNGDGVIHGKITLNYVLKEAEEEREKITALGGVEDSSRKITDTSFSQNHNLNGKA